MNPAPSGVHHAVAQLLHLPCERVPSWEAGTASLEILLFASHFGCLEARLGITEVGDSKA